MMEAVHRYEDTVNQMMGDGIMALFGAPLAHEDHAVRACYAALRMQESVKQLEHPLTDGLAALYPGGGGRESGGPELTHGLEGTGGRRRVGKGCGCGDE